MAKIILILLVSAILFAGIQAGGPAGADCNLARILTDFSDGTKARIITVLAGSTDPETVKTVIYNTALANQDDSMVLGRFTLAVIRLDGPTEEEWYKACTADVLEAINSPSPS